MARERQLARCRCSGSFCGVAVGAFWNGMAEIRHDCFTRQQEHELQRNLLGRCKEDDDHPVKRKAQSLTQDQCWPKRPVRSGQKTVEPQVEEGQRIITN